MASDTRLVKTARYLTKSSKLLRLAEKYAEIYSSKHTGAVLLVSDALKKIGNMKQKDITEEHQELISALQDAEYLDSLYLIITRG